MNFQMLTFASAVFLILGGPLSALTAPPSEPSYSRPSFEGNTPPSEPPTSPPPGSPDPNTPPPAKGKTWDLVCSFERGSWQGKYNPLMLTTMYSRRVDQSLYPHGSHYCKSLHPHRNISIFCDVRDGKGHVKASTAMNTDELSNATRFCNGVWSAK